MQSKTMPKIIPEAQIAKMRNKLSRESFTVESSTKLKMAGSIVNSSGKGSLMK